MNPAGNPTGFDPSHSTQCTCNIELLKQGANSDLWKDITKDIKRRIFASTSVQMPSPGEYFKQQGRCEYCLRTGKGKFVGNGALDLDAYSFRRARSEHLVFRFTVASRAMGAEIPSVIRLTDGVFIAQQARSPSSPNTRQALANDFLSSIFDDTSSFTDPSSISTFDMTSMDALFLPSPASPASSATGSINNTFTPFSYTIGAHYTSMHTRKDMMLRGQLPFWCQALILSECFNADPPIQANEPRHGLIPFAPDIPLTFRAMHPDIDQYNEPTFLLWHERLAMDSVPHELYHIANEASPEWLEVRDSLLSQILICNLDPDTAERISALGSQWALNQGIALL
ncbi:hypothetical protein BC940DRAFT_307043 [Gongronella butleri]|nr:hypothetical protein BC940DRAFT_307043 [Gongronella butleri]